MAYSFLSETVEDIDAFLTVEPEAKIVEKRRLQIVRAGGEIG